MNRSTTKSPTQNWQSSAPFVDWLSVQMILMFYLNNDFPILFTGLQQIWDNPERQRLLLALMQVDEESAVDLQQVGKQWAQRIVSVSSDSKEREQEIAAVITSRLSAARQANDTFVSNFNLDLARIHLQAMQAYLASSSFDDVSLAKMLCPGEFKTAGHATTIYDANWLFTRLTGLLGYPVKNILDLPSIYRSEPKRAMMITGAGMGGGSAMLGTLLAAGMGTTPIGWVVVISIAVLTAVVAVTVANQVGFDPHYQAVARLTPAQCEHLKNKDFDIPVVEQALQSLYTQWQQRAGHRFWQQGSLRCSPEIQQLEAIKKGALSEASVGGKLFIFNPAQRNQRLAIEPCLASRLLNTK